MTTDPVLASKPLGFPWETPDPFLFCVYHNDAYPPGNERLGPAASLAGRDIGMDFAGKDGWRMYHGDVVPGFPRHPHRGFETITLARRGYIDHSDSLGATARFGQGDAQWMTAGQGVEHAEMFPLVNADAPNPTELFQIWLNLPREDKLKAPYFTMFWGKDIPRMVAKDAAGRTTELTIVAGAIGEHAPPAPPPSSWAARADADVAVWTLKMAPGAAWTLPPARAGSNRVLYVFAGERIAVAGQAVEPGHAVQVRPDAEVSLENGALEGELLLLQGRPIGEPVVQHGPFVMNSREEIHQAMLDYQAGAFGGWPWPSDGPVHARDRGPFAIHADGREEKGR